MKFQDRGYNFKANWKKIVPVADNPNVYEITDVEGNVKEGEEGTSLNADLFNTIHSTAVNANNTANQANFTANMAFDLLNALIDSNGAPITWQELNNCNVTWQSIADKNVSWAQFMVNGKRILGGI